MKWTHIAVDEVAKRSGIDRADIVRKLDEWNELGAIQLQKSQVDNVYRLEKPLSTTPSDIEAIIKDLDASMETKEQQNIDRTKALIDLVTAKRCFARSLASYFGEPEDSDMAEECGHCTWCETHEQVVMPNEPPQPPDPAKVRKILDVIPFRDDPRFLAKIAFGVKSPRISKEKIVGTGVFESMNVCDFSELLRIFTKECARARS
jgi:hypothetical protein